MNRAIHHTLRALALCGALALSACGGCGEDEFDAERPVFNNAASLPEESFGDQFGPSTNGEFTFSPGDPGRMTGIMARVRLDDGTELVSNEVELILRPSDQVVQDLEDAQSLEGVEAEGGTETRTQGLARFIDALQTGEFSSTRREEQRLLVNAIDAGFVRSFDAIAERVSPIVPYSGSVGAPQDPDDDGIPNSGPVVCTGEDSDEVGCQDNCPFVRNAAQLDSDGDSIGDACEEDYDGDGRLDDGDESGVDGDAPCSGPTDTECDDNAPGLPNPRQEDRDGDGIGDVADPDADGDGTPDVEQGGADTDGDGIPNGVEGTGDTDGDGIPDYADSDDDGDGIPTNDEQGQDTDGDGIPDDRDTDSDGDRVPDSFEGPRDTDGDGIPDWQDDDDDDDGVPTFDERNGDEDNDGIPDRLDDTNDDDCERYPARTKDFEPNALGIHVQYDLTASAAFTDISRDWIWVFNLNEEGGYFSLQQGRTFTFQLAPDLASASLDLGASLFYEPPDFEGTTVDYYADLDAISVSFSLPAVAFIGPSFSLAIIRHKKVPVGLRAGVGFGISASLADLVLPGASNIVSSVSLSYSTSNMTPDHFLRVVSFDDCKNIPGAQRQALEPSLGDGLAANLRARSEEASSTPFEASQAALAGAALPLIELLEGSTGLGPARHIPAGSNADFFADFFARGPVCDGCPDTSLSYLLNEGNLSVLRAGGGRSALVSAGYGLANKFIEAIPDPVALTQSLFAIRPLLELATHNAFVVAARIRGDAFRFVDERVIEIPAPLGEPVVVTYTLQELSDLTGFPTASLLNTRVCFEGVLQFTDSPCFFMQGETATVRYTLGEPRRATMTASADLTTAAGPFGNQQVGRWSVSFATRVLVPVADEPETLRLTAPPGVIAGAPVTLNATLFDENRMTPPNVGGMVEFLDASGNVLGEAPIERGRASLQFVPTPTTPTLESVVRGDIPLSDGTTRPGFILSGTGFSEAAIILVDGADIRSIPSAADPAVASYATSTKSHEKINVITQDPDNLPLDISKGFTVVNPYDLRTEEVTGE